MNDLVPKIEEKSFKVPTFWERPEGVLGQVVGVLLVGGLGWGAFVALPLIITLLQNTIFAIILGAIAVALGFVVTDKRFWRIGSYFYQKLMRDAMRLYVGKDALGVFEEGIEKMRAKTTVLTEQIGKCGGVITETETEIKNNKKKSDDQLIMMKAARASKDMMSMQLSANQIIRLKESNHTYEDLLSYFRLVHSGLVKYEGVMHFLIKDGEQELENKRRKNKLLNSAYSVIGTAMALYRGEPLQAEMERMANEFLADDNARKLGEIDNFLRISDSLMRGVDLKKGIYEQQALAMLDEWENDSNSLVLGVEKRLLIENKEAPIGQAPLQKTVKASGKAASIDWFKS